MPRSHNHYEANHNNLQYHEAIRSIKQPMVSSFVFFFLNDPATPEIYPLPQPAALPIKTPPTTATTSPSGWRTVSRFAFRAYPAASERVTNRAFGGWRSTAIPPGEGPVRDALRGRGEIGRGHV